MGRDQVISVARSVEPDLHFLGVLLNAQEVTDSKVLDIKFRYIPPIGAKHSALNRLKINFQSNLFNWVHHLKDSCITQILLKKEGAPHPCKDDLYLAR
jgi:hypothetical protein